MNYPEPKVRDRSTIELDQSPFITKMRIIYVSDSATSFMEATNEFTRFRAGEYDWSNCGPDQEDHLPCSFKLKNFDAIYYCWKPIEPTWLRAPYSGKFVITVPDLIFV